MKLIDVVIDVEATGESAMTHSMIQIGHVDSEGNEFKANMRPMEGKLINPYAMKSINLTEDEVWRWPDPAIQMAKYRSFLHNTYFNKFKVIPWSDNPAFDWQYVHGYLVHFTGRNPMGHSMRRIGDYYAGIVGQRNATSRWKKLRDTKHTHDALDDAKGNMEALQKIMNMKNV